MKNTKWESRCCRCGKHIPDLQEFDPKDSSSLSEQKHNRLTINKSILYGSLTFSWYIFSSKAHLKDGQLRFRSKYVMIKLGLV